jgi:invasion protein IalB
MNVRFGFTRSRRAILLLGVLLTMIALLWETSSRATTLIPPSLQPVAREPRLSFSPWAKVCERQPAKAEAVCFTGMNGRTESGTSFVAAVLIDAGADAKKILRVTLPLEMMLAAGTWITVDQGQLMNAPYIICVKVGCVADYQASDALIDLLKQGKELRIGAVDSEGKTTRFVMPLLEFERAYTGAPTAPKVSSK